MMMRTLGREDSRLPKAVSDVCSLCAMSVHKLILSPREARCPQSCTQGRNAHSPHLKAKDAHIQVHQAHKSMAIQHDSIRTPLDRPHRAAAKKHREKAENHLVQPASHRSEAERHGTGRAHSSFSRIAQSNHEG